MAEHQRIHPVGDEEAPPIIPLVSGGSAVPEKGSPIQHRRPLPMSLLSANGIPAVIHSNSLQRRTRRRTCCCNCMCWTIGLLLLALVTVGAAAGILYLVFQPKIPNYSVDKLTISDFRLNWDMTIYAKFNVKITANNPNKKIGIFYAKGGGLSVWYTNTKLCEGPIPQFYQGHQNITKLDVTLTGRAQGGNTLMSALQEQQQTGQIPLDLKADAPVAIKLGTLKLWKVRILGNCMLVVDSLTTSNVIGIKASNCKFKLRL